mmetsp:Transcript_16038/g.39271  ORF Transcript_16038/g.39271 Transcript_16038/m.39271 type:complete len:199 (-) Transcript_16038:161-757(-)
MSAAASSSDADDEGGSSTIYDDATFNYRMIDYYPQTISADAPSRPRLAEHRDFGFITLVQASLPGLQVRIDNKWHDIPSLPDGTAVVMGGWCGKVRSNGRIPAALHRVPKNFHAQESRVSAVLFCNPKHTDTSLEPAVRTGEKQNFINGITATDLQKKLVESKLEKSVDQWLKHRSKQSITTISSTVWRKFRNKGGRG